MPPLPKPETLQQFVKTLSGSGVLSSDELRSFVDGLPDELRTGNARALTQELVRQKKLTRFQAKLVGRGETDRLVFGDYVLLEKIGAGGMGQVFKARNRRMDRVVALKLLPARGTRSPLAVARFRREMKVTARLDHPNIVAAYHAGIVAENHFLETQYIPGRDLKTVVDWYGPLCLADALHHILHAAYGLQHAHQQGIIHRDIKPANLLVDRRTNTVKILDWGLARIIEETESSDESSSGRLTLPDQLLGTADYMSPEQSEETHNADVPSDIYSLGCTLHYLIAGEPPYQGDTVFQVLVAHRTDPIPSLSAKRDGVPDELDHLLRSMMAKEVEDRCRSLAEVIGPLEAILKEMPASALATTGTSRGDSGTNLPDARSDRNEKCHSDAKASKAPRTNERDADTSDPEGKDSFKHTDKTHIIERELTTADDPGVTIADSEESDSEILRGGPAPHQRRLAPKRPAVTDETLMWSSTEETSPDDESAGTLRQLMGQTVGLQSGFAGLLRNDGKSSVWYNYQGDKVPHYHLRQRKAGQVLEWETPPVVVDSLTRRAMFVFAGALGSISEPPTEGFTFLINDREGVDFDLARQETCWLSRDHRVVLLFSPRWASEEDTAGFFYVSVCQDLVTPGDPCRFAVRSQGSGSRRWFSLCPATDAVKLQAELPPAH